jgi:sirohydrochlorin cobaltochelatase
MSPALPELVRRLTQEGIRNITVTPIFLGQGGHVLRDLPVLLDQLRGEYPALELKLATAVGEDETVLNAIRDYCLRQYKQHRWRCRHIAVREFIAEVCGGAWLLPS